VIYEALAEAQDINPFDLLVTTTSGERLQPTFGPDAGTQLDSATLNRGEKAKGAVTFDVPKTGVVGVAYARAGRSSGPGSSDPSAPAPHRPRWGRFVTRPRRLRLAGGASSRGSVRPARPPVRSNVDRHASPTIC
jgi:hypothetical protein